MTTPWDDDPWLDCRKAAAFLGLTPSGVRSLVSRGVLSPDGRGPRRTLMFRRSTLDRWIVDGCQRYAAQRYATSGAGGAHEQISVSGNRTPVVRSLSNSSDLERSEDGQTKGSKESDRRHQHGRSELPTGVASYPFADGRHDPRAPSSPSANTRARGCVGRFPLLSPRRGTSTRWSWTTTSYPPWGTTTSTPSRRRTCSGGVMPSMRKPSTVNSRLRVLRTLLRDAQAQLGLHRDPCARVRTLPEEPTVGNRLKPEQLRAVLAHLQEDEPELVSAVPHHGAHRRTLRRSLGPSVV